MDRSYPLLGVGEAPGGAEESTPRKVVSGAARFLRHSVTASGAVLAAMGGGSVLPRAAVRDGPKRSAPGERIEIPGGRLHLIGVGRRSQDPTVILESGAFGVTSSWAWVQAGIARRARVYAYDRAGLAWSDALPGRRDAFHAARDLRLLLAAAGESGPFVLVGHSLGGMFVRRFAGLYPQDVAGVVLVDSSHPDQFEYVGGVVQSFLTSVAPALARLGVCRASGSYSELTDGLPHRYRADVETFLESPDHLRAARAELEALEHSVQQVRSAGDLGDLPLVVLSASVGKTGDNPLWHILQRDLKQLSSRGVLRTVPGATHTSLLTDRGHARSVVAAVDTVLDQLAPARETRIR